MSSPIQPSDNQPARGDLVVRDVQIWPPRGRCTGWKAFVVAVHPATNGAVPHTTLDAAILAARGMAVRRGLGTLVWRELPGRVRVYEQLTASGPSLVVLCDEKSN